LLVFDLLLQYLLFQLPHLTQVGLAEPESVLKPCQ
jgi:hypothetical protein